MYNKIKTNSFYDLFIDNRQYCQIYITSINDTKIQFRIPLNRNHLDDETDNKKQFNLQEIINVKKDKIFTTKNVQNVFLVANSNIKDFNW
jgi:hypothetical protein